MTKTIITISRQYGSGGRIVAKKLSQKLNIPFYDHDLITMAAKESGLSEQLFENADLQTTNSFLYPITVLGTSPDAQGIPLPDKIFLQQCEVIRQISKQSCVIVGRCADYVLRKDPGCISVFLHASIQNRITRARDEYHLTAKNPEDAILKIDKKRSAYYNYYTEQNWGIAENYHLSIDSGKLGLDGAVSLIEEYVRIKNGG